MRSFRHLPAAFFVILAFLALGRVAPAQAQTPNGSVTLKWTAPGDDSLTGTASRYDVRYSLYPINAVNFATCLSAANPPRPAAPGTVQSFTVYGLFPGTLYYFAVKTADERLNWSLLSNVVTFAGATTGADEQTAVAAFAPPNPNPARTRAGFAYQLPERGVFQAEVFDIQGRLVRRLAGGEQSAGTGVLDWDLRDWNGVAVSAGIYLVQARIGRTNFLRRVVVTR